MTRSVLGDGLARLGPSPSWETEESVLGDGLARLGPGPSWETEGSVLGDGLARLTWCERTPEELQHQ